MTKYPQAMRSWAPGVADNRAKRRSDVLFRFDVWDPEGRYAIPRRKIPLGQRERLGERLFGY